MTNDKPKRPPAMDAMMAYYAQGGENERLYTGIGQLERVRTQELLARYLPPPPAVVFDIGGGPGVHASWLAKTGYEVHLIDAVLLHLKQAIRLVDEQPDAPIASFVVGDARRLGLPGDCADVVLFLGPLYHLLERQDRITAIREAWRILRPGGLFIGAGISRYASALVGLVRGYVDDPSFLEMVRVELAEGRHELPTNWPALFTESYFHHPDELRAELEAGGFVHKATLSVEGPGWLVSNFEERWREPALQAGVLSVVRWLEEDPVALGVSPHLLVVGAR